MHPAHSLSLLVSVLAVILASTILAREHEARGSFLAATALLLAGAWSLLDVLLNTAPDPELALFWSRSLGCVYLPLGPLCLGLLCELRPDRAQRIRPLLGSAWALALGLALLHWLTPWFVSRVVPTSWGFGYRFGPGMVGAYLFAAALAARAAVALFRRRGSLRPTEFFPGSGPLLALSVLSAITIATATDVIAPLLAVDCPRLGAASITVLCGFAWLVSIRVDPTAVTSAALAREVLDTLRDGVAVLSGDGFVRSANGSLGRLLGVPRESLVGRPFESLLHDPADGVFTGSAERETWLAPASGPPIPVAASTAPLSDRQGFGIGWVVVFQDRREWVELRQGLVTAGRLAAVGELAAGIAHEVNNPVAFIQSNLHLLERHAEALAKDGRTGPTLEELAALAAGRARASARDIGRVAAIVREVRGFAHGGAVSGGMSRVPEILSGALRLAAHRLRRCRVEIALDELPEVAASPLPLQQVFLDLLLRSAQAGDDGSRICIGARRDGRWVRVSVEDEGEAVASETLPGLLQPLSTEGPPAAELSVSHHIVRQLGGRLRLESRPGAGTRVEVVLPVFETSEEGPT